jgi:hypothetical protein
MWCLNNSLTSSSPHASTFGLKHSCALYKHDHIGFHAMRVALARAMKRRGTLRLIRADARLDAQIVGGLKDGAARPTDQLLSSGLPLCRIYKRAAKAYSATRRAVVAVPLDPDQEH